jgi:FKBP-type peptidyl-prolyl cis-trans isomerase (trigger factor)
MQEAEISDNEELQKLVRTVVDELMENLDRQIEQVVKEQQEQLIEETVRKHLNEQIQSQTPVNTQYRGG